jgi:hypothetical protein
MAEDNGKKNKKFFKRILISILTLVGIIVVGVIVVLVRMNSIARVGIEKSMSWALQVPVTVASVDISILSGEAKIRGLIIGNPTGYKTAQAFSIDQASARLDLASFRGDEPVIHEIFIQAPDITLEQGLRESNLSRLAKNTSRFSNSKKSQTDETTQAIKIERLVIEKGQVGVSSPVLRGEVMPVVLPSITLTNLGGKKGTPAVAQAMGQIFIAILEGVAQSGQGQIPAETLQSIQASVGGIKTLTSELKKSGGQFSEQFRQTGGDVSGLLKGLTSPKKDVNR